MDAVEPGKMWDCKTSKMSQSPSAALNASGLFAAESRGLDGFEPGHRGRALRGRASQFGGYSYAGYILTATHFAS